MIFAIQVYLGSLIGIAILVFISPLFIPMVLFEPTKKYFQGWLDAMIAFAMYPVVLFGFLALMLVTMDVFYWGEPRVGDAAGRNEKNQWRYLPSSSAQPFRCATDGSGYDSVSECRENCTGGECRLDQSLLELPAEGLFLCPVSMHIYEGDNAPTRCSDQCYQEIDVNDDRALRMSTSYLGGTLDITYDPPRLYRNCVDGNYKPEFKAECTDFDGGPLHLTKEICEQPENCTHDCRYVCDASTFGCQLYRADYGEGDGDVPGFSMNNFSMGTALLALLKVLGIGILFFYYLSIIGPTISTLVGNHKLDVSDLASNPQKVMKGIASMATSAAKGDVKGVAAGAKAIDKA